MSDSTARDLLPRRVGIHGMRSAGKTCFLGTLYGFRAGASATVDFADDPTCVYLGSVWKDLSEGRVPGATLLAMPTGLRLDLSHNGGDGPAVPLELRDYAGLLVEPKEESASPAARQLAGEARDWFRDCHAVLVFLDSSRPELEQVDALDLLLTSLRRPQGDGPLLERPVGIVLTKWDSQGVIGDDLAREQERARAFLSASHAFRQIGQKLDAAQVRVFPVSSFGNHARGSAPPELTRYHPCHLHAPLAWAATVSDLVLLDEAQQAAGRHLGRMARVLGMPLWPRPDHAAALAVWRDLSARATPGHGPLASRIADEVSKLQADRRGHWGRAVLALALAGLVAGLGAGQAASAADAEGAAVLEYCVEQDGPGRAGERLARAEEYLAKWWSLLAPSRRREVAAIRDAAAAILAERAERGSFIAALAGMEQKENWAGACEAADSYLERYPETPLRQELEPRLARDRECRDRVAALAEIARLEQADDLEGALAAGQGFLRSHPDTPAKSELEAKARDLKRIGDDKAEYDAIRRLARSGTPAALEKAARRARAYLDSRKPERAMRKEAELFWDWFEKLKKGGTYDVVVESLVIPSYSELEPFAGTASSRVQVTLNGKSASTGWLRGTNVSPNATLKGFPFKWGDQGRLAVRVEGALFTRRATVRAEESDPLFVLGKANGTLAARDKKGREVRVSLRCPAATPPDLPAYRRRG